MEERRDKIGRRIPQFDRSAAGKKAMETLKEKNGTDYPKRIGLNGARKRTRGYFGSLKDKGKTEELTTIAKKAREVRTAKEADAKNQADGGGENPPVSSR